MVHGNGKGRLLGYPTANLRLDTPCELVSGVYVGWSHLGKERLPCLIIVSVGKGQSDIIEVHILDWSGDLYGMRLQVEVEYRISDLISVNSPRELIKKIQRDIEKARVCFEKK